MVGSVFCSVRPCLTLLLNIIRQANMTDDEEDSVAEAARKRSLLKSHLIFAHSMKPISAAVLSCQM